MSAIATTSTFGTATTHLSNSCPRPPTPIMPTRTRSLAPSTRCGYTIIAAVPRASPPMNSLRPIVLLLILPPDPSLGECCVTKLACLAPAHTRRDKSTRSAPHFAVLRGHHRPERRLHEWRG